ncbi:MAG: hypothetical protein JJT96_05155 [Opitutales bacterium]|nr:hypothetical protein [Opitutales bacterium]
MPTKSAVRLLLLGAAVLFFVGCASTGGRDSNLLGIIETRDATFRPASPTTIGLSTKEIGTRDEPSGRETRLLWGLFTIKDY